MAAEQTAPLPESLADTKAPCFDLVDMMWKACVSEDVIKKYTSNRPAGKGCVAISDFAGLYTEANYEDKIETEVYKIQAHKDDDLEVSRVRVAWTIARSELTGWLKGPIDALLGPGYDQGFARAGR